VLHEHGAGRLRYETDFPDPVPGACDVVLRVRAVALTGSKHGVDVVVNYTSGNTWTRSLRVLRVGGRRLTCGATAGYDPPEDIRFIWTFELQIILQRLGARGYHGIARHGPVRAARSGHGYDLSARPRGGSAGAPRKSRCLRQASDRAMSDEPLAKEALRLGQSPSISLLNPTVLSADPAKRQLVMRAAMRPEFERGRGSGQWHGGPIAAIIDTVGDYALVMLLARPLPTINFRVDYLRPAIDTALVVTATVRRSGRLVGVVDIDVTNEAGQLLAIGRATYATAP
jgi:uncharacterized protein (TIGR00369 family)